jgi:hypothetical protein
MMMARALFAVADGAVCYGDFLLNGLPLILFNRNVTNCKQQHCRKQGSINWSAGEKVKRTTSNNGKCACV